MTAVDGMPERLGEYRLLDRIGEGGMGVVFLARGPGNRTVALKVLRGSVAGEPTARRRLAREVETMQRVRSPYVAEVIDADLTGDMPYVVTRYVPGRTLDETVSEDGPLRGPALARLARGLAEALAAVHAVGVVHRDLKPSNIMLVRGSPVLIDFGIAQGPDTTRLTLTGMFMGTPGYLAPEVIEGYPSSQASDVHTWGATVAFAATGRPPFGTGPYEGVFYRIMNGQVDLNGVPAPLLALLTAALARDPADRPPASRLSAQAAALDPGKLVVPRALDLAGEPGNGPGPVAGHPQVNVTRLDEASPSVLQAAPAPPPGVPVAPGMDPDPLSQAPVPSPTRPFAPSRPLPDDLADVLPPVTYERAAASPGEREPGGPPFTGLPLSASRAAPAARCRALLVFASVMIAAGISVLLPIAGTLASLALIAALRVGALVGQRTDARRRARGLRGGDWVLATLSIPWFFLRTVLRFVLLAPFALATAAMVAGITVAVAPGAWPARAIAYGCGALVVFYGLGPGSSLHRHQLSRAFTAMPGSPGTQAIAVTGVMVLAVATLAAAVSWPSLYWPSAQPGGMIHFAWFHLGPLRSMGLLRHASFGHRVGLLRRLVLQQFSRGGAALLGHLGLRPGH